MRGFIDNELLINLLGGIDVEINGFAHSIGINIGLWNNCDGRVIFHLCNTHNGPCSS